jgi:hypothetical protein
MAKPQYGYEHRKARARAIDAMPNGAPCPRCNRPMYKWQRLQLGHVVSVAMGGSGGPTRIEHGACNERAGARLGNRLRRVRRRADKGRTSLGDRLSDGMTSSGVTMPSAKGSKPNSDRDSKPIANSNDKSIDGIGGMGNGIVGNSSSDNRRLPKW